jgi:ethanolamine permease
MSESKLKKTLTPIHLWGLGVGYVISGMYFGWNLGLEQGGTLGMTIATGAIIVMYVAFSLSYAELACAIPKAGGAFDYTNRAMGKNWGFIAGMAQNIEFIAAPPAIAFGIGSYVNGLLPDFSANQIAIVAYLIFTFLNILGAKIAATFELLITIIAVVGLILFAGITLPHFDYNKFTTNALPHGYAGVFAAIPFAIWFFLGIEGLANVAEESQNPQRDITWGFGSAMTTLVLFIKPTVASLIRHYRWL